MTSDNKFKDTLLKFLNQLTNVCVRLDNAEGTTSYTIVLLCIEVVKRTEEIVLKQHYEKILSKYKDKIVNRDVNFFKTVDIYPGIDNKYIDFIFRMFESKNGFTEKEKQIVWNYVSRLLKYVDE